MFQDIIMLVIAYPDGSYASNVGTGNRTRNKNEVAVFESCEEAEELCSLLGGGCEVKEIDDLDELFPQLYLFVMDLGKFGVLAAIAADEQQARAMMLGNYNYEPNQPLERKPLAAGLVISNLGDS